MSKKGQILAIARITGLRDRKGLWPITVGGDGLNNLESPFAAMLYKSDYDGQDLKKILKTATFGPSSDGTFHEATVSNVRVQDKKGRIHIQAPNLDGLTETKTQLHGYWICIYASQLKKQLDEYYVYELLKMPVFKKEGGERVGYIASFTETSAHGVIEIDLVGGGERLLVPMIHQFVDFTKERDGVVVEKLDEFIL